MNITIKYYIVIFPDIIFRNRRHLNYRFLKLNHSKNTKPIHSIAFCIYTTYTFSARSISSLLTMYRVLLILLKRTY